VRGDALSLLQEGRGVMRERLNNLQIIIMRSLFMRGGGATPISLSPWQRQSTLNLWRRGLVHIWYRQRSGGGSRPTLLCKGHFIA
jgi:hypothetical protein